MEFHARQIAPPKYWQQFEDLCLDLFRRLWSDPAAQKNGRNGQPQHGTDIWGHPAGNRAAYHGVQCKGKDAVLGEAVTAAELRTEVAKAKQFAPKLSKWTLATTGPKDAAVEAAARQISEEHRAAGLFEVQVLGWEDLQSLIADHPEVLEKHYRDQAPSTRRILDELGVLRDRADPRELRPDLQRLDDTMMAILAQVSRQTNQGPTPDADDIALQARIDEARDLIRDGQPRTALKVLDRIKEQAWEQASARARFRILANRASALLELGDFNSAASLFVEAAGHYPNDQKARVNLTLGYLLQNDYEKARGTAAAVLSDYPDNFDAAALRVLAAFDEEGVSDPLSVVPQAVRGASNVQLAVARWHRHRGNRAECMAALERAVEVDPANGEAAVDLATGLLETVFEDKVAIYGHQLDTSQERDLGRAIEMLSREWRKVADAEGSSFGTLIAANLSTVLRFVGRIDEAEKVVAEALAKVPANRVLLRQKAHVLTFREKYADAISVLDQSGGLDPELRMLRAELLALTGQNAAALAAFDELTHCDAEPIRRAAKADRLRLLWLLDRHEEAAAAADQLVQDHPDDPLTYAAMSDLHRRKGDLEEARAVAIRGLAVAREDDALHRVMLADALYGAGDWDRAADVYATIAGREHDTHPLRRWVNALLRSDRRREAADLLSSLAPAVLDLPPYRRSAALLSETVGDLAAAKQHLDRYLAQVPNDLQMRLLWLDVLDNLGDQKTVGDFLDAPLDLIDATVAELMGLAHFLDEHGRGERAIRLAYLTLRNHWPDPRAHLGYIGLVIRGRTASDAIPDLTIVGPDAAFVVEDAAGRKHAYIVEPELQPDGVRGEVAPQSPLAQRAAGLRVGDRVRVTESPLAEDFAIVEVKHKYLHVLHRSMEEFNTLFPTENGLLGFRIDKDAPEATRKRMLAAVRDRSEHVREVVESYREGWMPLGFMARLTGDEAIDAWYGLMQLGIPIDVCAGNAVERSQALQALSKRPLLILDPVTFWIAGSLGALDALAQTYGKLGLTQSALEEIERRRQRRQEDAGKEARSMSERDGQLLVTVHSPDETRAAFEVAERILSWARREAVIVPAVPRAELAPELRAVGRRMDPSFLDTIAAASGSGRLLLSEDRRLRGMASGGAQVHGAWLQPALMVACSTGSISRDRYCDLVIDLALAGHDFITIDRHALERVAERNQWRAGSQFERVVRTLGIPNADLKSSTSVAAEFTKALWSRKLASAKKKELTSVLLSALVENHPDKLAQIVFGVSQAGAPEPTGSIERRLRLRAAFRDHVVTWHRQQTRP